MICLTPEQIKEIAEELELGMVCYIHKESKELVIIPDLRRFDGDSEYWEKDIERIEENPDDFHEIGPPKSHDSFRFMEEFTASIPDSAIRLRVTLMDALEKKKPFREFKFEIDRSGEFREIWFAFKDQKMINWVGNEIDLLNFSESDDSENEVS
jgi:hypothetical protein